MPNHKQLKQRSPQLLFKILGFIGLVIALFFLGFPIFWLLLTAFKYPRDAFSTNLLFEPTLQNFQTIFSDPQNFAPLILNSAIVSVATVAIAVPIATLAAYAFSRYQIPGKTPLMVWVLSSQFLPPVTIALPFFILFANVGLLDTRIGLIILNISITLPFAIWMVKGFIDALPIEIEEAALIDKASRLQLLRHITLPLIMPGIIAAGIFTFILAWNEFLFALVISQNDVKTLTIGLTALGTSVQGTLWTQMAAAGLIIMIPIFILSVTIRKYFVRGITMGAIK